MAVGFSAIVAALAFLFEMREEFQHLTTWRERLRAMLKKRTVWIAFKSLVYGCVLLFAWSVIKTIYDDHRSLVAKNLHLTVENTRLQKESQVIADKPDLRPEIGNIIYGPAYDKNKNAILGIVGTIKNFGSPATLNDIWLDLRFKDGRIVHGQIANPPGLEGKTFFGRNGNGQMRYLPNSAYWLTERSTVINHYGRLDGFVMALFKGITAKEIAASNPTVILSCSDLTDRKTLTERPIHIDDDEDLPPVGLGDLQKPLPREKKR